MKSPVIVGNVALAIPEAIALAFPVPVIAMISNTSIIPVTVPSKPNNGHSAIKPWIVRRFLEDSEFKIEIFFRIIKIFIGRKEKLQNSNFI